MKISEFITETSQEFYGQDGRVGIINKDRILKAANFRSKIADHPQTYAKLVQYDAANPKKFIETNIVLSPQETRAFAQLMKNIFQTNTNLKSFYKEMSDAQKIKSVAEQLVKTLLEKWSKKYKRSIDCNNPKGFSQRAHCQARKARQAHRKTKSSSVSEDVNYEVLDDSFEQSVQIGDYMYHAKGFSGTEDYSPYLTITVTDPKHENRVIAKTDFAVNVSVHDNSEFLESESTVVDSRYQRQGIAYTMYAYARSLGNDIKPSLFQTSKGEKMWKRWGKDAENLVGESLDNPYPLTWDKGDFGDVDTLAQLDDGTYLHVMFNKDGDNDWFVEFFRDNSQAVTGRGDSQRVFATVLRAIKKFISDHNPEKIVFSSVKDYDPKGTRTKLYNKMIDRYADALGYQTAYDQYEDRVIYSLSRKNKNIEESDNTANQDLKDVADWMNTTPDKLKIVVKQEPIEKFIKQIREMYATYNEFPEDEERTARILKLLKRGAKPLPIYVEAGDKDLFVMEGRHRMVAFWLADMKSVPVAYVSSTVNESASGYIPSNAEKNDWRFKTALTVDVHPDSIQKNAEKLGLGKIHRSGVPRTARSNGKIDKSK